MELPQKKQLWHFSVLDLNFDRLTFKMQRGDRGTVGEHMAFTYGRPKSDY